MGLEKWPQGRARTTGWLASKGLEGEGWNDKGGKIRDKKLPGLNEKEKLSQKEKKRQDKNRVSGIHGTKRKI